MAKPTQRNSTHNKPAVQNDLLRDYRTTITILEHLSDAVFILNETGKIEYANKTALDILRIRFSDLIGKLFIDILDPEFHLDIDDHAQRNQDLIEKITSGVLQDFEILLIYRDYATPVVLSFGVVRAQNGEVSYIIASAKDITVRKELERKLSQQQMIAIAKDRYRELGEMAVSLVHELSQPLTTLRLSMELTQKLLDRADEKKEQIAMNMEKMINLISTMSRSISNVRTFANQTEDESLKPVSIEKSIEEARELVSYELKNRDINVHIASQPDVPGILANPINLQQVFVTLIRSFWENFERFSVVDIQKEEWDKKILIAIRNNHDKWVEIDIEDNLDLDLQKFLKPAQAGGEVKKAISGMELHIATARIIINSLGGDFRSMTRTSGGKRYAIRIPFDHKEEREELYTLIEMMQE